MYVLKALFIVIINEIYTCEFDDGIAHIFYALTHTTKRKNLKEDEGKKKKKCEG